MKKSEELLQQAASEENDFKALQLNTKAIREKRFERWNNYKQQLIDKLYVITESEDGTKITIDDKNRLNKYGIIDFYPKANKLLIRKSNKWINQGLKWIITKLC